MISSTVVEEDQQWASLTRSIYSANIADDVELRRELCKAYGAECRKRHILSPSDDHLHEAEIWEFADKLSTLARQEEPIDSFTMESFLQTSTPSRILALKEWLEECQPAFRPTPVALPSRDLDNEAQQIDADSLRCAESVFKLLRVGKLESAVEFFKQCGVVWKAAVMLGGRYDRPNQERQVWRQAIERLLLKETSWEAAWLGCLVGQIGPAIKVLRSTGQYTWRDAVWLNCVAVIDKSCEQVLSGSVPTLTMSQVFNGIDAPKDRFYYACKAIFLDSSEFIDPTVGNGLITDDRFALHMCLLIGDNVKMADALLSEWILSRQTQIYSVWYLSLLSSFDKAAELLSIMLVNSMEPKSRKSLIYAANEAGLKEVVVKAADLAIGTLGCAKALDLLTVCAVDAAIRRINDHARLLLTGSLDWLQTTSELSAFFALIPDSILSANTLDLVAQSNEAIVAEVATYLHLCRLAALYTEYTTIRNQPPAHSQLKQDFGAAAKFAERSEQAWRLRVQTSADAFIVCAEELLSEGGAWEDKSISMDVFMQRLRANYAPALRDAVNEAKGAK